MKEPQPTRIDFLRHLNITSKILCNFTKSYQYSFVTFYENNEAEIFQTAFGKSRTMFSWSHYFVLIQEVNADALML